MNALVDRHRRPLRDLRISVIDRCNFRCPYCMPEDQYPRDHEFLSKAQRLRFEEIQRLAAVFAGLGVHKLRLTGGEPLLRRELPVLVRALAAVPGIEDIALTTNGSLLATQADALRAAGLTRITLSLDGLAMRESNVVVQAGGGEELDVAASLRIGITKAVDWPLRFAVRGSKWVSRTA